MEKELKERVKLMQDAAEPSRMPFEPDELDSENAKRILLEVIEELHLGKEQHERRKKQSEGT